MRYVLLLALLLAAPALRAQPRLVTLAALIDSAEARDARSLNVALLSRASRLRLAALRAQRLPRVSVSGQATYQSDAPVLPVTLPGVSPMGSPLERFYTQAELQQVLYDGGRLGRQAEVERAALEESRAAVAVSLYALRQATAEAFFGVLLAEARLEVFALQEADLTARLALLKNRQRHGAALAADTAALAAERLRLEQARLEAWAQQEGARAVLAQLTGTPLTPADSLVLPRLPDALLAAPPDPHRPELDRLARAADRMAAEARWARSAGLPQVSLIGQAGVGRPSPFEPFGDATRAFGLVGVRLSWAVLDWGAARHDAEARTVQAQTLAYDAEALRAQIMREAAAGIADLARYPQTLDADRRAIALREEVVRVARRQLEEGVLLPADYTLRLNELGEARLGYARHRVEQARAAVRLALILGLPLETP